MNDAKPYHRLDCISLREVLINVKRLLFELTKVDIMKTNTLSGVAKKYFI